ncbi:MAG: amidohydrolase, partial [Clostridia bacterium]|nr:amidohydrolase [Clostridia bacterium]
MSSTFSPTCKGGAMRLLFSGADILRPDFTVLKNAFLGVDGAVIDYIGAERPTASYDEEKDMRGKLLMPGLYNMHTHTSMVLLRGLGSDLPLDRWLHEAMFPIEARLTPEDISVGTRLAMMEMLSTGTVSFTDMYDMPRVTVDEVSRAGMKANLNRPVLSFDPDERYEDNHRVTESLAFFADCNG